jgi:hypothetical protein
MKQLLQTLDSSAIVGLHDCALAVVDSGDGNNYQVIELACPLSLEEPKKSSEADTDTKKSAEDGEDKKEEEKSEITGDQPNMRAVQAVALTRTPDGCVWYAVARYDKSLTLYYNGATASGAATAEAKPHLLYQPVTLHKTVKRVSSLSFAHVSASTDNNNNKGPLTVVIAGDLAGDVTAFPLRLPPVQEDTNDPTDEDEDNTRRRVLVGHTASMLTAVRVVDENKLLTADRDEKIRISSFPDTHIIQGYLLGHEAFVSCFDVTASPTDTASSDSPQLCVSGSGYGTIRLWDLGKCQELACCGTQQKAEDASSSSLIPTSIQWDRTGNFAAVIYDVSVFLDLFQIVHQSSGYSFSRCCRVECGSQPLGLCPWGDKNQILVLACEPVYAQAYQITVADGAKKDEGATLSLLNDSKLPRALQDYASSLSIAMATSLLERDKFGTLKMDKINETRGPTHTMPWNDYSRKETAKERNRRCQKRRREREFLSTNPVDDNE